MRVRRLPSRDVADGDTGGAGGAPGQAGRPAALAGRPGVPGSGLSGGGGPRAGLPGRDGSGVSCAPAATGLPVNFSHQVNFSPEVKKRRSERLFFTRREMFTGKSAGAALPAGTACPRRDGGTAGPPAGVAGPAAASARGAPAAPATVAALARLDRAGLPKRPFPSWTSELAMPPDQHVNPAEEPCSTSSPTRPEDPAAGGMSTSPWPSARLSVSIVAEAVAELVEMSERLRGCSSASRTALGTTR